MEKNQIIELIKQNRISEAIDMLEKASVGTDTHHELILLASSFSDYAKKNRTATLDSHTLEMQRNQITNKVLYYLDELPADALSRMAPPPVSPKSESTYTAQPAFSASHNPQPKSKSPALKYGLIGAGAVIALIIAIGLGSSDEYVDGDDYSTIESSVEPEEPQESQGLLAQHGMENDVVEEHDPEPEVAYNFNAVTYYDTEMGMEAVLSRVSPGNWILKFENGAYYPYQVNALDEWNVTLWDGEEGYIFVDLETRMIKELIGVEEYSFEISEAY